MQLINFVETNTGRSVVFAKNILCVIYNICDESEAGSQKPEVRSQKSEVSDDEVIDNQIKSAESNALDNITLTPNPTTGELRIENGELRINNVEIYDIYGRNVSQISYLKSHISYLINISHLPAEIYFVKINTETNEIVKTIVKQ